MDKPYLPTPYTNSLPSLYFRAVLKEAVKFADLSGHDVVLDFGCGTKELAKFLPKTISYINYDVVPEYSAIKDYRKLQPKPDAIFCLSVLEHLSEKELRTTLKNFKKLGVKKIIISLPSDSMLNRFLAFVFNRDVKHCFEHRLTTKEVATILVGEFGLPVKYKRIYLLKYLAMFNIKTRGGESDVIGQSG